MKNRKAMQKYTAIGFSLILLISMAVFASSIILPGDDDATDTDGGYNIYQKGTCTGLTGDKTDYCTSANELREYEPSGITCVSSLVSCPCSNGICASTSPTDSDNGIYPATAGECTYWTTNGWATNHDYWDSSANVFYEGFISGGTCDWKEVGCNLATQVGSNSKCIGAMDYDGSLNVVDQHFEPSYCTTSTGITYYDSCVGGTSYELYINSNYPNDCHQSTMVCTYGCNSAGTACKRA